MGIKSLLIHVGFRFPDKVSFFGENKLVCIMTDQTFSCMLYVFDLREKCMRVYALVCAPEVVYVRVLVCC